MKYHELKVSAGRKRRQVGRGISAGRGKAAGRGTKGQGSRKSSGVRPGFEGGQMPLYMRLPKLRGFKSHRPQAEIVYTGQLEKLKSPVDNKTLFEAGLVSSSHTYVKLVIGGKLTTKRNVRLQAASATAINQLQEAGGSFTTIDRQPRSGKVKKVPLPSTEK